MMEMSREMDKYIVRLPSGLRDKIKVRARANRRSMNQEIVVAIEAAVQATAGDEIGVQAPAVAERTDALASVNSINSGKGPAQDEQRT